MDKNEAKLILSSYTLGNEPSHDERFEEAKAFAEQDPDLLKWWASQKTQDQALRAKLATTQIPPDLRSALKETMSHQQRKLVRFAFLKRWSAIAAAFALAGYLFFQYGIDRSDDYLGPLAKRAYDYSVDGPRLTYFNKNTQNLKTWLVDNGFRLPDQLPPKLLELEGIGCRPLKWSDDRVALMCFNADTVYHLFIGFEEDFPEFEASEKIGYEHYADGWTIGKWKDDDHLFVLTAKTTPDKMSNLLASYQPGLPTG